MELAVKQETAIRAYRQGGEKEKQLLITLFGEAPFNLKITDRIKTYQDAIEELGLQNDSNLKILIDYNGTNQDIIAARACALLGIVARALNEGWDPDWTDGTQNKYVPWFIYNPGVGFSYDAYGRWNTFTLVGSRLCFRSASLAEYAGKQFQSLYNDFLTL